MNDGPRMTMAFPKPGPGLRALLFALAIVSAVSAVVVNWAPGPPRGGEWFRWLVFLPDAPLELWRFVTSGVLTSPTGGPSHIAFSLLAFYFLTPDLERRWGWGRLARFLFAAVVTGNLFVWAAHATSPARIAVFHPSAAFGPGAAITATAIAWATENRHAQVRLFFVLPVSGRQLYWFTVAFCLLSVLYFGDAPEGVLAPVGGLVSGILLSGSPSPTRALYLRAKLFVLRRRSGGKALRVEDLLEGRTQPQASKKAKGKAPSLRVVQGGKSDSPPDKEWLN